MPAKLLLLLFLMFTAGLSAQKVIYNFYDSVAKDYELMSVNLDGTGKKNISNHKGIDWTYYAYNDVLYFISDRDTCHRCFFLYRSNSEGENVTRVSDLQLEDSWMSSRNGGKEMIVSGRTETVRNQLFLLNLKNGSYKQLTNDTAAFYNDPTFVNDGKQIAYRYKSDKRNRNMITEIWIMDADGTNKRQLTRYPKEDKSAPWHAYHAGPPRWNEGRKFISYQSMRNGRYHIFAVTPDGKRQWQVTDTDRNEGWHDWMKNGDWIVFDYFDNEQDSFDIMLMNVATGENRNLSAGGWKQEYCPVFIGKQ